MRNYLTLFIKGFVIGIGKIIPGVSGAIIAISLGVYEKGIKAISNFFYDVRYNTKFLGTLGLGIMSAIILFSNIIKYSLDKFYLPTMLLFIGLIVGGIPMLFFKVKEGYKNRKNIIILFTTFVMVLMISFFSNNNEVTFDNNTSSYLLIIIAGFIDAAAMIIPGISGTAILMLIGCYDIVINTLSNLVNLNQLVLNLQIMIPFIIGIIIGGIIVVKMMAYLFKYHEEQTYFAIIGLALSSVFMLLIQTFNYNYQFNQILIGMLLLILGYKISRKLDN